MQAKISSNNIKLHRCVFETNLSREETAESVVPDTLPDILEIVDADGIPYLRSKEVEQGRVILSGNVGASVVYLPDGETGCRKLNLTVPFNASAESVMLHDTCKIVGMVRVVAVEARMLNPRKVLVRIELAVSISCYEEGELEISNGIEESEIQTLILNSRISPVVGVEEKTFVISDEYQLPAAKPQYGDMLKSRVDLMVDDVKSVGNKLIFKGAAQVGLMYAALEDSEPVTVSYSSSFSQIIEMEGISEQPDASVSLMLTGAYFEPLSMSQENRTISAELHVVAQLVCSESSEITYIADAFSNHYALELESHALELKSIERRMTVRETLREVVDISNQVREIIGMYAVTGTAEVDGGSVRCPVNASIIYRNESDKVCRSSKSFSIESALELEGAMSAEVVNVRCDEMYASPASGGIELRMPLDIELLITEKRRLNMIVSIEADEENTVSTGDQPSVTVLRSDNKADLWMLAKKYRSTTELIVSANNLDESESIPDLLLIPRAR